MLYVFGDCTLDVQRRIMYRAGQVVRLRRKVFQALTYLLTSHDRAVSKEELCQAVWSQLFISDAALESTIRAVRRAIGDRGRAPALLQTVHGYGYRFVAAVAERPNAWANPASEHVISLPVTEAGGTLLRQQSTSGGSTVVEHEAQVTGWEQKPVVVLAITLTFPRPTGGEPPRYEPWTVVSRWEQTIVEMVQGFGGVLIPCSPALLTVLFGMPHALDKMPQRAVRAALALQSLVAKARPAGEEEPMPEVRMAVHVGAVQVEVPARTPMERLLAIGDTLSLPVQLLGHAAPGELLVSPHMARLVGGQLALEARTLPLRAGQSNPVGAYSVTGVLRRHSPSMGHRAFPRSRFVGREHELATLHALLAQVQRGQGRVVGIVGEPGMGKSRLLVEFRQCLAGQRVTSLEGRCLSYASAIPYTPVRGVLWEHCGITSADSPAAIAAKVRASLQAVEMDPEEGGSSLLQLLGVPAGTDWCAGLSPEASKRRTFETLRQMLLRSSQRQPLIVAIENLHWIDKTSEDFLTLLVDSLAGAPILVLLTSRPGYRPPWIGKSYRYQLTLQPLTPQDSCSIVQAVLQTEQLPERLVQTILDKAAGNPFFLEELAWATMQHAGRGADVPLPDTIQAVLMVRIDQLGALPRQLLQAAAVLGKEFPLQLLEAIWEGAGDLEPHLTELQRLELLYERPAIPEPVYTFKHVLGQEAAYASLTLGRRRALHERAARAMEALYGDRLEEHCGELAHHYLHSGNSTKALAYLQLAGQQALQRSAYVEAVTHFSNGLELLKTLPDTLERDRQELEFQTRLGPTLMASRGYAAPEVKHAYIRAQELCEHVGDTPQLFSVLRGLCIFCLARAEFQMGRALGEQLFSLAKRTQNVAFSLEAHPALGLTLLYVGEFGASRHHLEQGVALYDPQQHRAHALRYGNDPGIACLSYGGRALWFLGYPDQALQREYEGLALAESLSHSHSMAQALGILANIYQARRQIQPTHANLAIITVPPVRK